MAMPKLFALKSNHNNKYMRYKNEDRAEHGLLQFSETRAVTSYTKYEVELAKCGNGLVNIKSCYNNKYLTRWTEDQWWIFAGADEPEEDQSRWYCTLFKPIYVDVDAQTLRLLHVQLGHYTCLSMASPHASCLFAGSKDVDKDKFDVYTIIDWETLAILPKHIAFKGDNGFYIGAKIIDIKNVPYLEFSSTDIADPMVAHEIFVNDEGNISVRSEHYGLTFWRRTTVNDWIWVYSRDGPANHNPDRMFRLVKIHDNVVALQDLGNNKFCKRFSYDGKTNCLAAVASTITREARLEIEELVISRQIYHVDFRLQDARIYNQHTVLLTTGNAVNYSEDETRTIDVKLQYDEIVNFTWKSNASLKLSGDVSLKSGIPLVIELGKICVSKDEFDGEYKWGKMKEENTQIGFYVSVTVPPRTMVKVSLFATKASCDVPFSYTQRDTYTNAETRIENMDDGMYTGISYFDIRRETEETSLCG